MKPLNVFRTSLLAALCLAGPASTLIAQGPQFGPERPPMERSGGPRGPWWRNADLAKKIGITDDQVKKMDEIFQQNRLALVDQEANLQKEEIKLQPLVDADSPDEAAVIAQIDRVAQARAELEKTNARLLLAIRKQLTVDQWQKLKAEEQKHHQQGGPEGQGGRRDGKWGGRNGQQGPPQHGGPQGGGAGGPEGAEMQRPNDDAREPISAAASPFGF